MSAMEPQEMTARIEAIQREQHDFRRAMESVRDTMREVAKMASNTDSELKSWVRTVQIAGGAVVGLGIFALGIMTWVLTEKNDDLRKIAAVLADQQVQLARTVEAQRYIAEEVKRQGQADGNLLRLLAEEIGRGRSQK